MTCRRAWRHIVAAWIVVTALTTVPYLYGLSVFPQPDHFVGFTYNIDDACVYLTWINQARDGHFLIRNLYTTEPQRLLPFNLLFLAMGLFSRLTTLSPTLTYHLWRVALILVTLFALWRLCRALDREDLAPAAIWLASLSSGLGWLVRIGTSINRPVDLWQPEAITFLSAYLNPLFLTGIALMLWASGGLVRAVRENRASPALGAGAALLLLANIHTYDLLTVGLAWALYAITLICWDRARGRRAVKWGLAAAAISLPTVAYQVLLYAREPVYRLRAQTPAESPAIWFFLIGYGLLLAPAAVGAVRGIRNSDSSTVFLTAWALAGFAAVYLPLAQQRKLIMGTHIPLCALAADALVPAIARVKAVRPAFVWALALAVLLPSNLLFLRKDLSLLSIGQTAPLFPPALTKDEVDVMRCLARSAGPDDVVLAQPNLALFVPALAGKRVYFGHWSETVDYQEKFDQWLTFADVSTADAWRERFLRDEGVTLVVQNLQTGRIGQRTLGGPISPHVAAEVYRSGQLAVYRVPD